MIPAIENDPNVQVQIFNRHGVRVYQSNGFYKPWNGQYKWKNLPSGVFYYVIFPKIVNKKLTGFEKSLY
jgi:gliding motility-associated-like protein